MAAVAERIDAETFLTRDYPRGTQLIDGVVVLNSPTPLHQHVCLRIVTELDAWARAKEGRGVATLPLGIVLDPRNVAIPDVLWFADGLDLAEPRAPRAPELAVEVRSPSTWRYDIGRKRALYEQHGVRELWLVDTASRTIVVFRRSAPNAGFDVALELDPDHTLESPLLPGFAAPIGDLVPAPER